MKILLVNDNLGEYGGAEISLKLAEKLLLENGHQVKLFGSESGETFSSLIDRFYSTSYYCAIRKLIIQFRPTIVHFNSVSRILSPSVIVAAARQGIPLVMTIRDPHLCCAKSWAVTKDGEDCPGFSLKCLWNCRGDKNVITSLPFYLLKYLKVKLHRKIISSQVKHFISPSKKLKAMIQREFNLPDSAVSWLPNFVEIEGEQEPAFSVLNSSKFVYIGRVSNEKGIDTAVHAFSKLVHQEKLRDISLEIIGDGPALDKLKKMVEVENLRDHITFTGQIHNQELEPYYLKACAVIMPSIWMENNPRTALEAMKHGKPIIASNVGGFPDLIDVEETGLLFKTGDAEDLAAKIKTLYHNHDLSVRMGTKAYQKLLSEFSKEAHYQKLMELYLRITGVSALYSNGKKKAASTVFDKHADN